MKTTENILKDLPDAFLWDDKTTIDVTIQKDDNTFLESLIDYKCPKCDYNILAGNEHLCQDINENVRGIELTCKSCNQQWFIHEKFSGI